MNFKQDLLNQIYQNLATAHSDAQKTLVVFDLDSTLFDISPRTQAIVEHFSHESHASKWPQLSLETLKTVKVESKDWGIKSALIRHGLDLHAPEFLLAIRDFWIEKFFHPDLLIHDKPIEGAAEFTQKLFSLGCELVYLSGRDDKTLRQATEESLQRHHFAPAELILKPQKGSDDALFKAHWFKQKLKYSYNLIYFFENEPLNLIEVEQLFPQVKLVFIDTTHSGKAQVSKHWPVLVNFS